ncbi:hypothetical protein [Desulfosporosinus metallidurans]|uniref:Phage integrase family protein n=1 Tax=Desulfosporosinus metallidurans TaxID=1888891 RepID=A0A1Q8R1T1_9FIRM|nr:hypothetical protein [Desulfosporosinus metallidurans]OLN33546.1 phage integrase family protein [Desulfosporosinus metallidurans]
MAQIRNRGSKCMANWDLLRKEGGVKQTHYETFYGTKPQAKAYANDIEKELKRKVGSSKSITFTIIDLFDKWLNSVKSTIDIRTYESYEYQTKRLRPFIGDLQL